MDNLLREFAGTSYRYDERGNLIERLHQGQRSTFEWDAFNRMIKASTPSGITAYIYDPLGRRIAKHHLGHPITHIFFILYESMTYGQVGIVRGHGPL